MGVSAKQSASTRMCSRFFVRPYGVKASAVRRKVQGVLLTP